MELTIEANVLPPRFNGEQYLVIASAAPVRHTRGVRCVAQESGWAANLEEATHKCCEMARVVTLTVKRRGARVVDTHCSHCPAPEAPACRR